jgi:hypothetical protein
VITTEAANCRDLKNDSGVFSNPRQVKAPNSETATTRQCGGSCPPDRRLIQP